jgi:hypothetical protein
LAAISSLSGCSNAGLPSPRSVAAPAGRPVAGATRDRFYGCPVFGAGHPYNDAITNAPVDKNSASYISSLIEAGDVYGFYASTGVEQVNVADRTTPLLTVQPKSKYHAFPVRYPWKASFFIEPLGDHHAMVVQTHSCRLYESYDTSYSDGTLSAFSGANWQLRDPFRALRRGKPSAMASGLPLFAGMVRWEEYQSGAIAHALNWDGIAHTVSQYQFVDPASDTDRLQFYGDSPYQLPYGARLRLKASFSTAGWGPQATMVATAMKTYGIYLADTGTGGNALYFANAQNGSDPWISTDLLSLSLITIGDFDVIELPNVQSVH